MEIAETRRKNFCRSKRGVDLVNGLSFDLAIDLAGRCDNLIRWRSRRAIEKARVSKVLSGGLSRRAREALVGRVVMEIQGKTVLVTGASSGIGAAIAKAMAQAGAAEVLLLARNEDALKKVAAEIVASGGKARIYSVDLSDPDKTSAIAQRILSEAGVPDILINNAGIGQWKFLDDTTPKEIQDMMALPYFAAAWLTRAFLPAMRRRDSGHIVNISSIASRFVWPGATAYIAARWAVRGLTEALRADLCDSRIGVTLYESAEIESPYWLHNPGSRERVPKIAKVIQVLKSEEVGKAVVAGVRGNKRLIVIPFMMKVIYLQHALFPWSVQWLMTATWVPTQS